MEEIRELVESYYNGNTEFVKQELKTHSEQFKENFFYSLVDEIFDYEENPNYTIKLMLRRLLL